ncbi:gp53-like domain-containing protein [Escherichia coli]|uniref:gp53-like domain-containing protein n=1 Tax=Escherichia coli TaxID=562 RepID=UPI003DA31A0C
MHRIDTKTAQKDKFGAGKNGFTRGNPQTGTPATDLDDDYFDMLQEELCGVVEASGASLEKGRNDQLLTALRALLLSRKNPFGDIKSDGTVKTALENLGLGEAAKRDVGNGQNQIPDMSAWECGGDTTTGWRRSPDGYIEQWGLTEATTNEVLINFPIPFPTAVISINEHDQAPVAGKMSVWQFYKLTNSNVIAENLGSLDKGNPSFNVPTVAGCRWFATGR